MLLAAVQDTSRNHQISATFLSLSLIKAAQIRAGFNWEVVVRGKRLSEVARRVILTPRRTLIMQADTNWPF